MATSFKVEDIFSVKGKVSERRSERGRDQRRGLPAGMGDTRNGYIYDPLDICVRHEWKSFRG
jgi:hypothetical protein